MSESNVQYCWVGNGNSKRRLSYKDGGKHRKRRRRVGECKSFIFIYSFLWEHWPNMIEDNGVEKSETRKSEVASKYVRYA